MTNQIMINQFLNQSLRVVFVKIRGWAEAVSRVLVPLPDFFDTKNKAADRVDEHILLNAPWHAVSLVSGKVSCTSCAQLKGVRFLSNEAPRLPLETCAWPTSCKCVYRHYSDRRRKSRRVVSQQVFNVDGLIHGTHSVSVDRRRSEGRRNTDAGHSDRL